MIITDNSCDFTVSYYQMPFSPLVDWEYLLITIYIDTKLIRWFFFWSQFFHSLPVLLSGNLHFLKKIHFMLVQ